MSYLYFVVQNSDKQRVSQINRVNVPCNLLALLKSDDSDLLAANASRVISCVCCLWGTISWLGPMHVCYCVHCGRKEYFV